MTRQYIALITAYFVIVLLWFVLARFLGKRLWSKNDVFEPRRPYLELIFALLAVFCILGMGQLYLNGLLIPNTTKNIFIDAVNQFLIFIPTLALPMIRKQSIETLWIRKTDIPQRFGIGLGLALVALFVTWIVQGSTKPFMDLLSHVFHVKNSSHFVQVFMEDITIAMIFVRLSRWLGNSASIIIVASLFAAGHIPSMLAGGALFYELGSLLLDTLIGIGVLVALSRSRDIWWFFPVHFALDMTQYFSYV
nr:hypothetical protein [Allomuricauda sp.]